MGHMLDLRGCERGRVDVGAGLPTSPIGGRSAGGLGSSALFALLALDGIHARIVDPDVPVLDNGDIVGSNLRAILPVGKKLVN